MDDQEWFAAFPDRRLRLRPALPEECREPARLGVRWFTISGRDGKTQTFQAGHDFARRDGDRELSHLLSQLTKKDVRA
jgi:hypothetical protein